MQASSRSWGKTSVLLCHGCAIFFGCADFSGSKSAKTKIKEKRPNHCQISSNWLELTKQTTQTKKKLKPAMQIS